MGICGNMGTYFAGGDPKPLIIIAPSKLGPACLGGEGPLLIRLLSGLFSLSFILLDRVARLAFGYFSMLLFLILKKVPLYREERPDYMISFGWAWVVGV